MRSTDDTPARKAAAAALVCLRVLVPKPEEAVGWGYVLLPDMAPLAREDVLDALVAMPKRVRCTALAMGGCLAIAAWPGPEPALRHVGRTKADFQASERARRERQQKVVPHARLLFAAEHEEPVLLTLPELWLWQDSYRILGLAWAFSPVDDAPDELTVHLGGTARVQLDRPWYVSPPGGSGGIAYLDDDEALEPRPAP